MGWIRATLVTIFSILLFLTLFSMNTFLTISLSLDYDLLEPEITDVLTGIVSEQVDLSYIDDNLTEIASYCANVTEFAVGGEELGYNVSCDLLMQGSDAILESIISEQVNNAYYQEYDCDFWDCASTEEIPLFLISQKAKDYWRGWFYWSLFASIVIAAVLFIVSENRNGLPILIGTLILIAGLPFLGMGWLLSLVAGWEYAQLFFLFFTQSHVVFLFNLVIGIVLIGIGIVLKFLNFGEKISGWFSKLTPSKSSDSKSSSSKSSDKD